MRNFLTGATRDSDENKNDYEGFLHPLVIEAYGDYMRLHCKQADGTIRNGDNWQKGIPKSAYMKSAWRHFLDWWYLHRGIKRFDTTDHHAITKQEVLCALLFNVMGYLYEELKPKVDK